MANATRTFMITYAYSTPGASAGTGRMFVRSSLRTSRSTIAAWEKLVKEANPTFSAAVITNFVELEEESA